MAHTELDQLSRPELIAEAKKHGVERPERMTRVELRDEIVRLTTREEDQLDARGLFGVARSMLASVVEAGLKMPDAAKMIRGEHAADVPDGSRSPVATVTLAEIYAAQGHKARALAMLDEVLRVEPGHEEAVRVRCELLGDERAPSGESQRLASGASLTPRTDAGARSNGKGSASSVPSGAVAPVSSSSVSPASTSSSSVVAEYVPPETTEYVPGASIETIGEEIATGKPPEVVEAAPASASVPDASGPDASGPDASGPDAWDPALVVHQSKAGLRLYWELPEAVLGQCGLDGNDGQVAVKIVAFVPAGASPSRQDHTHYPDPGAESGVMVLDAFAPPAAVRAAVGWESEGTFLPLSVGRPLEQFSHGPRELELAERAEREFASL